MFEHDRIDVSEGIDTNKTGNPRRCIICSYWLVIYHDKF